MNDYIPEEYSNVIKSLEPIVEKYELDSVMVSSIVRGSIEKEEQPIQPASKVWKSKDGNVYTVKPANIKVNLSFAIRDISLAVLVIQYSFSFLFAVTLSR